MNQTIQEYQQDCWKNYKTKISLPQNYNYLYGNPVKVHVPVDVATGGLMIVGAYPTAQFNSIEDSQGKIILDVPVADHLFPFSNDKYFDGSRVTCGCNLIRISGRARLWILNLLHKP